MWLQHPLDFHGLPAECPVQRLAKRQSLMASGAFLRIQLVSALPFTQMNQ